MNFKVAPTTEGMTHRWTSENDVYEIGLRPMFYGVRVSVGRIYPELGYAPVYCLDYCAGSDLTFLMELFATVVLLMSSLPESIMPGEIERLFPRYERKPISLDPCWDKLQELCRQTDPFPGFSIREGDRPC